MGRCCATNLTCWACGRRPELGALVNLSPCGKPLRVAYDVAAVAAAATPGRL